MVERQGRSLPWATHFPQLLTYSTSLQTTINDLHNNFKWNWMDNHGSTLLSIIHDVYGAPPLVLNCSLGDAEISEGQPPSGPSTASMLIPNLTQCHKSRKVQAVSDAVLVRALDIIVSISDLTPCHYCVDIYAVIGSSPQCPKKASMLLPSSVSLPSTSLPANSNLVQPPSSFPHDSIQISTHMNSFKF